MFLPNRTLLALTIISLTALGFFGLIGPSRPEVRHSQGGIFQNPTPFDNSRAPVSATVRANYLLATNPDQVKNLNLSPSTTSSGATVSPASTGGKPPPSIAFNLDPNPLPQNEETIAINPVSTSTLVGGYNDYRALLALLGGPTIQTGFSGFSITNDAGTSVRTDGDLPRVLLPLTGRGTISGGDPAIDVSSSGTFYYTSLYYNFSCTSTTSCESAAVVFPSVPSSSLSTCVGAACWGSPKIVADNTFNFFTFTGIFNDKPWMTVDRTAHASGVYVTYTGFNLTAGFTSPIVMVRCSYDLSSCSSPSIISGPDRFDQGSFVSVRTDGSIAVTYFSFDTSSIRGLQCSPGTGVSFTCSSPATIAKVNVPLFISSTEGFRIPGFIPQMAVDHSSVHPNRVIVVWQACATSDEQGPGPPAFTIGTCPQSFIGAAFTDATTMAGPWTALNVTSSAFFPTVSIDSTTGTVNIAYYSTINDPFMHRLDLFVTQYLSGAFPAKPSTTRLTSTSDEPSDDPLLIGFFFGDYIQAAANAGVVYFHYTANYIQKGSPPVFQEDNFLTSTKD